MIFNRNNTVATQQGMKTYWLWYEFIFLYCKKKRKNLIGQELLFLIMFASKTEDVEPQIQFLLLTTQLPLQIKT
jgi:hypothetical protein